jgi:hypothetical protein
MSYGTNYKGVSFSSEAMKTIKAKMSLEIKKIFKIQLKYEDKMLLPDDQLLKFWGEKVTQFV